MDSPSHPTSHRSFRSSRRWLVAATLALLGVTSVVHAKCSFSKGNSTGIYTVSVPATIINDPSVAVGAVLYTSNPTGINQQVNFTCTNNGNSWGLMNQSGAAAPPPGQFVFPTNIAGVGFQISQASGSYPGPVGPWPFQSLDGGSWYESDPVTVQLVKTGNITNGSILSGPLAGFKSGSTNGSIIDATVVLANSLTFVAPACNVPSSLTVSLPTVTTNALTGGSGKTSGDTAFTIPLTCATNVKLAITLDSANPVSQSSGVLSSSGTATGVGVQLVWNGIPGTSGNAVALGQAVTFNATSGSSQIPLVARYYRSTGTLAPGSVTATATYTLTYP